jgi:hypothetical protein
MSEMWRDEKELELLLKLKAYFQPIRELKLHAHGSAYTKTLRRMAENNSVESRKAKNGCELEWRLKL